MNKNKEVKLSWDDFKKLGNPDNAIEVPEEVEANTLNISARVRVHFEKKRRGGKSALIIKGIEEDDDYLAKLCKKIKSKMGVGGSSKNQEIIIQGSDRKKVISILEKEGFKNVKPAGG